MRILNNVKLITVLITAVCFQSSRFLETVTSVAYHICENRRNAVRAMRGIDGATDALVAYVCWEITSVNQELSWLL